MSSGTWYSSCPTLIPDLHPGSDQGTHPVPLSQPRPLPTQPAPQLPNSAPTPRSGPHSPALPAPGPAPQPSCSLCTCHKPQAAHALNTPARMVSLKHAGNCVISLPKSLQWLCITLRTELEVCPMVCAAVGSSLPLEPRAVPASSPQQRVRTKRAGPCLSWSLLDPQPQN